VVTAKRESRQLNEYVQEIQETIRERYPDAEFRVLRKRRDEVTMDVIGNFENPYEVSKLVAQRTTDILVKAGIFIVVVPVQRDGP